MSGHMKTQNFKFTNAGGVRVPTCVQDLQRLKLTAEHIWRNLDGRQRCRLASWLHISRSSVLLQPAQAPAAHCQQPAAN